MSAGPACVRDLIERQDQLRPQAVYAVDAEGVQKLTYRQLTESCEQVALLLRRPSGSWIAISSTVHQWKWRAALE